MGRPVVLQSVVFGALAWRLSGQWPPLFPPCVAVCRSAEGHYDIHLMAST
jgi:hypothetical protein